MIDKILQYDCYLFDLDGTLINTEPLHHMAYEVMANRLGSKLGWDFDEYLSYALVSRNHLFEKIYEKCPELALIESDPERLRQKKIAVYEELFQTNKPQFMPGVEDFLDILKKLNKQVAIVTNSPRKHVEKFIHLGLKDRFEMIITIDDFTYPKPSNASYLHALTKLQKQPHQAVIFEDSLKGVQAAIGANVDVLLIAKKGYKDKSQIPDQIPSVESFTELNLKILNS